METRVEQFESVQRINLNEAQVAQRADRMAHLVKEICVKEADAAAVSKKFKGEIARLESTRDELASEVRDKATYGSVDCERRFDYREGIVTEVRLDTGETLGTRPLTAHERQMSLVPDSETQQAPENA